MQTESECAIEERRRSVRKAVDNVAFLRLSETQVQRAVVLDVSQDGIAILVSLTSELQRGNKTRIEIDGIVRSAIVSNVTEIGLLHRVGLAWSKLDN